MRELLLKRLWRIGLFAILVGHPSTVLAGPMITKASSDNGST